jgi:hypothetical protein
MARRAPGWLPSLLSQRSTVVVCAVTMGDGAVGFTLAVAEVMKAPTRTAASNAPAPVSAKTFTAGALSCAVAVTLPPVVAS